MYRRILVPLDRSATAERGLMEAIGLARGERTQLVLLHVIDDFPRMGEFASNQPLDELRERRRSDAEHMLDHGLNVAHEAHVKAESLVSFAVDSVRDSILEIAALQGCGLIVIGTHGRSGVRRAVPGSVAEGVSRHSPIPVLLVPPSPADPLRTTH